MVSSINPPKNPRPWCRQGQGPRQALRRATRAGATRQEASRLGANENHGALRTDKEKTCGKPKGKHGKPRKKHEKHGTKTWKTHGKLWNNMDKQWNNMGKHGKNH